MGVSKFFILGDDWGGIEVVPAENRRQYAQAQKDYEQHHAQTELSPYGWTTPPFILPSPEVPLQTRRIPLAELQGLLGPPWREADTVAMCEDSTGPEFTLRNHFAFLSGAGDPKDLYHAGVYGELAGDLIVSLYVGEERFAEAEATSMAVALAALAHRYDLILVAHGQTILDLQDREATARFLAGRATD